MFGSLAARQAETRETLYRPLAGTRYRVFDVNMRSPHYTRETVEYLPQRADLVKLNNHELAELMGWCGEAEGDEATALQALAARFDLPAVCVTLGADGALLWLDQHLYRAPGVPVAVADTIGSGDAFLAALLKSLLTRQDPAAALRFACAADALFATHQGATPKPTY